MAVDGPGVRHCIETVKMAKEKNLAMVAGFCYRYSEPEVEIFRRVHDGGIGPSSTSTAPTTPAPLAKPRQPEWSDMEWQCRNWLYFTWLSGDHIVEQAIHTIDKMIWAMKDVPPINAVALGGRQSRTDPNYGHIFDHFTVVYEWKDGTKGFHTCRQQEGTASDVSDWVYGTDGSAESSPSARTSLPTAPASRPGSTTRKNAPTCTRSSTTSFLPRSARVNRSTMATG